MNIVQRVLDHFIPEECPFCQSTLTKSGKFCQKCIDRLEQPSSIKCKSCGGNLDLVIDVCSKCLKEKSGQWDDAISVFTMNNTLLSAIEAYKYGGKIEFVKQFSESAAERIKIENYKFDLITSIPLYFLKYLYRGYNQSSLLGKEISKRLNIKYSVLLRRNRFTVSQTKLSRENRQKNLLGSFSVKNKDIMQNKDILLVDDVFTTGSTFRAAAEVLKEAGASKITILALARR